MSRPPLVLVPGAFHTARCFDGLVEELDRLGVGAIPFDPPGHGASTEPLTDLYGDATALRSFLDGAESPVTVLGHSYGGMIVTIAAHQHPAVLHLVYLAACMPDVGESVHDIIRMSGNRGPTAGSEQTGGSAGQQDPRNAAAQIIADAKVGRSVDGTTIEILIPERARERLYHDCSEEVMRRVPSFTGHQEMTSMQQVATRAAWRDIDSTYVVCTWDRSLPPDVQRKLAMRARSVIELQSAHSPFLSIPRELASKLSKLPFLATGAS